MFRRLVLLTALVLATTSFSAFARFEILSVDVEGRDLKIEARYMRGDSLTFSRESFHQGNLRVQGFSDSTRLERVDFERLPGTATETEIFILSEDDLELDMETVKKIRVEGPQNFKTLLLKIEVSSKLEKKRKK